VLLDGVGTEGQERLLAASVLVVGAGGLGSGCLPYLAAAGFGRITIVDGDRVEESNLNRQVLHRECDLGRPKAESAAERVSALYPEASVTARIERVDAGNALAVLSGHDVAVDCTDTFAAKFLLNDAAWLAGVPLVHAGVVGYAGQATTVLRGKGPCLRCLFPERPLDGEGPLSTRDGILGAAAGFFGALQAAEAVKAVTGAGTLLCGRLLVADLSAGTFRELEAERDRACPLCGESPRIAPPLRAEDYL
jgi:molybdopterin/thiamine biosynthesis adenylyltransferase